MLLHQESGTKDLELCQGEAILGVGVLRLGHHQEYQEYQEFLADRKEKRR
jgi:hypothetical protein